MDRGSKVSEGGCNGDRNALQQACRSRRHLTAQARVQPPANASVTSKRASSGQAYSGLLLPGSFHQRSILVFYSPTTDAIQSQQLTHSQLQTHDNHRPWPRCHGSSRWDVW